MFPTAFFPDNLFAPRYFPKVGASVQVQASGVYRYAVESESRTGGIGSERRAGGIGSESRASTAGL